MKEISMLRMFASVVVALLLAGAAAFAGSHQVSGEVVKVDKATGRITLKHGPIRKLDMDAMTMVFRVADPAMLDMVKAGDKVRFEADRVNGAITITTLDKAR
jgi:Cu/Ag efflux protein CusF